MYLLSLDAAAKTASVCVSELDPETAALTPLAHTTVNGTLSHSETLLPMIDFCLSGAGIPFDKIGAAIVTVGPGSFTGVRIGVATVKGLAFSKPELPCVGVSSLASLACNLSNYSAAYMRLALMDARREQFYNAFFRADKHTGGKRVTDDALLTFDEIVTRIRTDFAGKKIVVTGDGAALFYRLYAALEEQPASITLCDQAHRYPDAFSSALAALPLLTGDVRRHPENYTCERLSPLYLRASQAERERNQKLAIEP